jgi:glycosyltransferase involved in cell wall biosynthesis
VTGRTSTRPLRVLDLRDTYEIGGPGKTIIETYRAIDASRFELHLAVFQSRHDRRETPFVAAAVAAGMPLHIIRGFNQFDPRMILQVARLVQTLGIDILHAHEVKSDVIVYLANRLRRVAIVTTAHGWFGDSAKARAYIALDKRVARGYDRVIAVSRPIYDALRASGVPDAALRLLHNGIVTERYRRSATRGSLAEVVGRPLCGPVIVSVGRLSPEKGHADLIDALALAARQGCRVTTVLAGDGPDRARLEEQIRAHGLQDSVHLPGYVSEPQRVLNDADLMVLPSHTEGLPNAALEALMMEVPVLATRVGGTPEVITDGETGRLVAPHSPEALAREIADFVARPGFWKQMALNGRTVVERDFNFGARTRRLEQIYADVAAEAQA